MINIWRQSDNTYCGKNSSCLNYFDLSFNANQSLAEDQNQEAKVSLSSKF
jgi:hypothetical protein